MRALFSFFSPGQLACLAWLAPSLVLAQNLPLSAFAGAADPAAPTALLNYQGITPRPLQAQQLGAQDWRMANAAVSDFPRGHADIVGWEAAQARANAVAPALPAAPAALHGNPAADQPAAPDGAHHHPAMHPQPPLKGQP